MIGAGMAGLAAAAELVRHGRKVLVLEARARVGGRVLTRRSSELPLPIELGAEFAHGDAPRLTELARAAAQPLIDIDATHWRRSAGRLSRARGFESSLQRGLEAAARHVRTGADRSFAHALAQARVREPRRSRVTAYVEGFQAAHAGDISARALAEEDLGTERIRRTLHGCDKLAQHMRDALPPGTLRASTVVTQIRWRKADVEVECRPATGAAVDVVRATRVIVTLPLGVLAASGGTAPLVTILPHLPRKARAMSRLAMGHVVRMVMLFRVPFWRDRSIVHARPREDLERIAFLHGPGLAFPTWWTTYPVDAPILTAWAGGAQADRLAGSTRRELIERALSSLAQVLGVRADFVHAQLLEAFHHDWSADPFARGAYSHPLVGGVHAGRELARPVDDTLFFAGEATCAPPDNGTVDGALGSGLRAAREALGVR